MPPVAETHAGPERPHARGGSIRPEDASKKMNSENEPGPGGESAQSEEALRRALALYEARLSEFAELAARVRHEINNPLTGLIGQTQLLLRDELSDTARRRVTTIEQLANRIRDTVAELRSVQLPPVTPQRPDPGGRPRP